MTEISIEQLYSEIYQELVENSNPKNLTGMAKVGITPDFALGTKIPILRAIAKRMKRNHALGLRLWEKNNRETRILASMIADPKMVTEEMMEQWVLEFNYWEICDQVIMNLFEKTPFAYKKSFEWSERDEEFVKRAGFVLMARLAVCDKKAENKEFLKFLPILKKHAQDDRNMVKKGINWALRQIGKRNRSLNVEALKTTREILTIDSKHAQWIAKNALKELTSEAIQKRLKD
ncbi:MAG: DNA alkylation repair protein [Candidatus Heimdallarchaeota archaeon]